MRDNRKDVTMRSLQFCCLVYGHQVNKAENSLIFGACMPLVVDLTRDYGLPLTPAPVVESTQESQWDCIYSHTIDQIGEII